MINEKFIIACLEQVETKEELNYVWDLFLTEGEKKTYQLKTHYLKETMGGDKVKYFDVPKESESEYNVIEMMFLSGNWRYGMELDKIKSFAENL